MVSPPEFFRYPELRAHFDALYDLLAAELGPRAASPVLDLGSGNGSTLAAITAGTDLRGVAIDLRRAAEWQGPPGFPLILANAAALPFPDNAFPTSLNTETIEWLTNPVAVLREAGRVSRDRIIVEHTSWESLWFDSDDPDTSQEFTRLFAREGQSLPTGDEGVPGMGVLLESLADQAGLRVEQTWVHVIRGDRIETDTYAKHLLALMREWLCNQLGAVRARRFDAWRTALDQRAAAGEFSFSLDRHVILARPPLSNGGAS